MLTTKINKQKRKEKIAREKEEKIRRENNQKMEKERRKRIKKRRRQKIKNLEKRVINSSPDKLSGVSGEIRNDSDLLEKDRQNLEEKYYRRRIAGCLPEELPEVREEIKNDPCLTKQGKKKLWIQILNKLSSLTNPDILLVNNVINQIREESLEELGEEEYRKHIRWQLWEAERVNSKMKNGGVKPP